MPSLTAAQLINLRTDHPHVKTTYLSPVKSVSLLAAMVNNVAIAQGAMTVAYDTGTGTAAQFALITAGQTVLLGTAAGQDDLGRGRVTGIAGNQVAGTLSVAWNYDIDWADNMYLTVLHLYELWPKFPRFTVTPEDFFKDYDDTYTDENSLRPPVAIMGPPWAGFLGVGGTVTVDVDGQRSYGMATGATIAAYAWTVATAVVGAAPAFTNPAIATTDITFDMAGLYWVRLTVTDTNGKTQWTTRPFVVHDSSNLPYYIESASRVESWESGGAQLSFEVQGSATKTEIPPKTPVILWSVNTYNGVVASTARMRLYEYVDRDVVDFFGYVVESNPVIKPDGTGTVSFRAVTVETLLASRFEYPVALLADRSVTGSTINEWWKVPSTALTVAMALHHLWKWHSTLFEVTDVWLPTSSTLKRAGCEEFTEGSLLDRAKSFALDHGIFAKPVCNFYGVLYVEIDTQMLSTADRAAVTDTFTLATTDWREELNIVLRQDKDVAMAYISGGAWDGSRFTPLLAKWGTIANQQGASVATLDRVMTSNQADINRLCGRVVALLNNPTQEMRFTLAGNWSSAIGCAPQEWIRLTLTGTEGGNHRGLVYTNIRAKVLEVTTSFNEAPGVSNTAIVIVPEAFGRDGITGDYPDGGDDGEYNDYDDPPAPVWSPPVYAVSGSLLIFDFANGCYFSPEGQATWTERNAGKTATTATQGGWDPWWFTEAKQYSSDPEDAILFECQPATIWRSTNCGTLWSEITPIDAPRNDWGDAPAPVNADLTYVQRTDNIHKNGAHYFLTEWQEGGGGWRGAIRYTNDDGLTWGWKSLHGLSVDEDGYIYPITMKFWYGHPSNCLTNPGPIFVCEANQGTAIDIADGTYLEAKYHASQAYVCKFPDYLCNVVFDFGVQIQSLGAAGKTVWVNAYKAGGTLQDFFASKTYTNNDALWQAAYFSGQMAGWSSFVAPQYDAGWLSSCPTAPNWYKVLTTRAAGGDDFRYFSLNTVVWNGWTDHAQWFLDTIRVEGDVTLPDCRPIWADTDSQDGSRLFVTVWRNNALWLDIYDTTIWTRSHEIQLGNCLIGELGPTYTVYPYTPTFDKDTVYLFGRWSDLTLGLTHLAKYTVSTGTITAIEQSFGADHLGAFRAEGTVAGGRVFYGVRNSAGAVPKFYHGTEGLAYISDIPFPVGAYVYVDALTIQSIGGVVACASDTSAAVMVVQSPSPYTTWEDITSDFPIAGGSVRSLTYV